MSRKMLRFRYFVILLCFLCTEIQASSDSAVGPEKDLDGGKIRVSEEGTMNQEARRLKLTDLPPEQAERSLLELVDHIDSDGNSGITVEEMVEWMMRLEKAQKTNNLRDFFRETDRNDNGFITLAEFAHTIQKADKTFEANVDEALAYARPLFNGADEDNDGQLTLKEYAAFMHPELHLRMIDVLVNTFLEQFDNNDDGYVSFFEYMAVYMPASPEDRGKQPDWAEHTRTEFRENLDLNKDGLLDRIEMRRWVTADVTEAAHSEAKKLLFHVDKDNNGELSPVEVLGEMYLVADSKLADTHHVTHEEL